MLSVSLNEVEQISLKAARGAGAGWGVAEDVARATRWMAERGLDWSAPLLRLLASGDVAAHLRTAFEIADLLPGARCEERWIIEGCAPVWGLAILSAALYGRDATLDLAWSGGLARQHAAGGMSADRPLRELGLFVPERVTVTIGAEAPPLAHRVTATARRSTLETAVWREIGAYAARTYVAASARSRTAGAGGGRVDDD
ncbi:MAG TPA: DUF3726 domain-containing protein [Lichenihabitans sp.]|jgi:hypothetical protein|nr:DUF3726 domain-containing protein [Lichenihabitans sp.]